MTDARAVVGLDRLPWLTDEPRPTLKPSRATTGARDLVGWAVAALLVVAGASYWVGTRVAREPLASSLPAEPEATVKLPDAREDVQQNPIEEVPEIAPAPSVAERTVQKPAHRTRFAQTVRRRTLSPMDTAKSELADTVAEQEGAKASKSAPPASAAPKAAKPQPLRLWPAQESQGANGRIVRIGSFGSRQQAKLGWRRMQRVYPAVARLPATIVTDRNSRGRVFYRFQIGTTSQAHSEVLCQRMEKMLRFSCAVVGLPWKAKVER